MPDQPPISAELWARCRRFDSACSIVMSRIEKRQADGKPYRVWMVRIAPHERLMDGVRSEAAWLSDALVSAVEQAEERGWHHRACA